MNMWVSRSAHVLAPAIVAGAFVLSQTAPDIYERAMQEDRFVEWLTVSAFLAAGVLRLRSAIQGKRIFDFLVALFCLFVAGEEMSWGQRLIGYTPPGTFLENNTQQELTVHNFASAFGKPKWTLVIILVGYGVILPLIAKFRRFTGLLRRLGATPPPIDYSIWYLTGAALLIWYPLTYTGEWVELMAGILFLLPAVSSVTMAIILCPLLVVVSLALTAISGSRGANPAVASCAQLETQALLADLLGGAGTIDLFASDSYEKRLRNSVSEGDVDARGLVGFNRVKCANSIATSRRDHGVDPWGNSYWVTVRAQADGLANISVYSFGPNRRRDESPSNDDIRASTETDPLGVGEGSGFAR